MLEDSGASIPLPLPAGEPIPVSAGHSIQSAAALRASRLERLTLGDLAAIRNLLRSGSVIDWHRLYFADRAEVDRFLRVNELDPDSPDDMSRLTALRDQAVEYLERHLGFRIPDELADGIPARDLLLVASQKGKRRTQACIVLKVMHVLHHLAGRELLTRLPMSVDQIFHLVEDKVLRTVEEMKSAGCAIVEFEWSRKHADSLITKLLAKRETIAADVYDKLRFRTITQSEDELIFAIQEMAQRLVPFNYVIPGQSVNDIVDLRTTIESVPALRRFLPDLLDLSDVAMDKRVPVFNEFSGPNFRVINFVADLPVRIDKFLGRSQDDPLFADSGPVVFVLTEFQIVDARTAADNERGENSHERYKERQANRVRARLMHGMKEKEEVTPPPSPTILGRPQDGDLSGMD
jgi:uncharacterized protein (TIGR04552 family)